MELRVTSLDATRTGYRVDGAGSDKPTKPRGPVAGTPSTALAGLVRQLDRADGVPRGAMQVYSVRGVSPVSPGDGSEFGKALEAAADKKIDTLLEGVDNGLSPAEAAAQADKALGKTDPQSNFAALNPVALRGRDEPPRPDVAAQSARALAHGMQPAVERTSADGVAHRGVEETHQGDGSIFDRAIDVVERKWAAVGDAAEQAGLSEDEANAEANKAIGISNPQANFSADATAVDTSNMSKMRRLATALRPSGLHRASSEAGTTPRLQFPALRAPRFA